MINIQKKLSENTLYCSSCCLYVEPLSSSGHTPSLVYCASSPQSSIIVSLFYFQLFILAEVGRKMAELQPRHKVMLLLKYFTGS